MKRLLLITFFLPLFASAKGITGEIRDLQHALDSGLLVTIFAKELCSCRFVEGFPLKLCRTRTGLNAFADDMLKYELDEQRGTLRVSSRLKGRKRPHAIAQYDFREPRYGCKLVRGPLE